jgi:hypothetical protein
MLMEGYGLNSAPPPLIGVNSTGETELQHYSISLGGVQGETELQHYSITALQHYSITALQHYSITALQHYSITALVWEGVHCIFFLCQYKYVTSNKKCRK